MGNRRMGLGRMEALLEQIDRELTLTDSTLLGPTITDAAALTVAGVSKLTGNTGLTAGAGFSDAALYKSWIENVGGITITNILIDLTGIHSTAANDIIGNDGVASANIGQYTVAKSGTLFAASMHCLEVPAGGDPDINLASALEATLAEDSALAAGTNPVTIINAGDHSAGSAAFSTAMPNAAGNYFYLVSGAATDADYTTGVLHIKLYGTTA